MIVAGIGCRRNASAASIEAALAAALRTCRLTHGDISAIATAEDKADEPGLKAVASAWGVPVLAIATDRLVEVASFALTRSQRVMEIKGVPSVAETAALAAAGPGGQLLCARTTSSAAACAIASALRIDSSLQDDAIGGGNAA